MIFRLCHIGQNMQKPPPPIVRKNQKTADPPPPLVRKNQKLADPLPPLVADIICDLLLTLVPESPR